MKLYLASSSSSRRMLLERSELPFTVIYQDADELACDWTLPLEQLVLSIASHKMKHVSVPIGNYEGEMVIVLTADSLTQDEQGTIVGKPTNKEEAIKQLGLRSNTSIRVATGFCLLKKLWREGRWDTIARIEECVVAECVIDVPQGWRERYYDRHPVALRAAGGFAVEGYGMQFVREVHGSMTTIIGLPLYEVIQSLEKLGFFHHKVG